MSEKLQLTLPKAFGDAIKSLAPGQAFMFTCEDGARYAVLKYEEFERLGAKAGVTAKDV